MSRKKYDRISKNESDGRIFYGYDDKEDGTTTWYDEYGNLDSRTDTPSYSDEE
ncbi:hypothetical protein I6E26_09130 [Anaerovibrio lipolyticus]|uniref:hypothetical protein n=1 Tax=Anaerovibrio lipolyticus TaxID=82374 RepID=UPI001F17C3F8|nr:hypothetical protein [Anaerovibrio lipolyticus]MCF2601700.1 hypothetical protein [Anaerovibrio lipolyticus]